MKRNPPPPLRAVVAWARLAVALLCACAGTALASHDAWPQLPPAAASFAAVHALLLGAALMLAAVTFALFLARPGDRALLLFGLFCLAHAVHADATGQHLLLPAFVPQPPPQLVTKVEIVSGLAAMALFLALAHRLFEREMQPALVRAALAAAAALATLVLLVPAQVPAPLAAAEQGYGLLLAAYVTLCIGRAARHGREDAPVLLAGLAFLALAALATLLHDRTGTVPAGVVPLAVFAFVLSPGVVLARRMARALDAEEQHSREQREKVDLLLRATKAGIYDWDDTRNLTTYSPRLREMLGYPPDADTTDWPVFFEFIHPADREQVRRRFAQQLADTSVRNGEVHHGPHEYRLLRRDGTPLWVHAEAISLRGGDGRMLRYICSFLDITDQRALAESLQRQNAALAENARLRDDVERMSRHDLKTPLNSIIGVTRLLREDARMAPEHGELLEIAERAGYRLLEMINLSLDLSRMELGSYEFRPQAVNLQDVLARVVRDLQPQARARKVQFVEDALPEAPLYARAEELLCYSILANLLKNAVEATPAGGTVHMGLVAGDPLRLWIRNPGRVPEEIVTRFFDKYVTAGKAGGTGLGTYSARLMARVQEGDLAMDTSAEGTTVTLTLRALGTEPLPAPQRPGPAAPALPVAPADFAPRRVLVVDDDEYNLLLLLRYLPSPPFTVETAGDGRSAIEAMERHWPDIVVIDMEMPVMNGLEAVQWLRRREQETGRTPCVVLMLSSNDDEMSIRRGLEAGSNRYLTKPVTREALLAAMHELDAAGPGLPSAGLLPDRPPVAADAVVRIAPELAAQVPAFLDSRRQLADAMAKALEDEDREELRRLAHRAGGGLALFGFGWAAWQSRRIEAAARTGERAALAAEVERLREHLRTVQVQ